MGFFSEKVETFHAGNTPLFAYPETGNIGPAATYAVLASEDIMAHVQRHYIATFGRKDVHKFVNTIKNGVTPSVTFPEVKFNIRKAGGSRVGQARSCDWMFYNLAINPPAILAAYDPFTRVFGTGDSYGGDSGLGGIEAPDPDDGSGGFISVGLVGIIGAAGAAGLVGLAGIALLAGSEFDSINVAVDLFGGVSGLPFLIGGDVSSAPSDGIVIGCKTDSPGTIYVLSIEGNGDLTITEMIVGSVPPIPTGVWDIATGYLGDPIFANETGSPDFSFGSAEGVVAFPPLPLRVANQNYDTGVTEYDPLDIEKLAKIVGLDAEQTIKTIMESDDVSGNEHKVDNVFINFGVRLWDNSGACAHYLWLLFDQLELYHSEVGSSGTGEDECEFRGAGYYGDLPIDDSIAANNPRVSMDSTCHEMSVKTKDFFYRFNYASVERQNLTLGQVLADPTMNTIYNADSTKFNNGVLVKEYWSTSSAIFFAAGYIANDDTDVVNFVTLGSTSRAKPLIDDNHNNRNMLKVDTYVNYSGTIFESNGAASNDVQLAPGLLYERNDIGGTWTLKKVDVVIDQKNTPFVIGKCHAGGMEVIVLMGLSGSYLVEDATSEKAKMVYIDIRNINEIIVPFIYGFQDNLLSDELADVVMASMHINIIVADVEVVKYPWWAILLKIISVVIFIVMAYFGLAQQGATLYGFITKLVIGMIVAKLVVYIGKQFGGFWAAVAAVVAIVVTQGREIGTLLSQLVNMAGQTLFQIAMYLKEVLFALVGLVSSTYTAYIGGETSQLGDASQAASDQHENDLSSAGLDSNIGTGFLIEPLLESLWSSIRTRVNPIDPGEYIDGINNSVDVGTGLLDIGAGIDNMLDINSKVQFA